MRALQTFAARLVTAAALTSQTLLIVLNLLDPDLTSSWQTLGAWVSTVLDWL